MSFWRWRGSKGGNTTPLSSAGTGAGVVPTGTAAEALCTLFGDEEISDVTLQGGDGGSVIAVKAILASRSMVFRQKLFGQAAKKTFTTTSGKEVLLLQEWDCIVLHLVVEFCYTDNMSVMKVPPSDDIARLMANLRAAAKYFKLPGLQDKVDQWSWRNVNRHPALSCALIDEGMRRDDIDEVALQTLSVKARASLMPPNGAVGAGVLSLSKSGLLFVLRTLEDSTSHLLLFNAIQRWVNFSTEDTNPTGESHPSREQATREAFARKCAMRFIKLSKINPSYLDEVMKNTSLFTSTTSITTPTSDSEVSSVQSPNMLLDLDKTHQFSERRDPTPSPTRVSQ